MCGKGYIMNEVIENVLSNETYTTNEEIAEAIKQGLATLVIPKDKYNDLNAKYKAVESNYTTLSAEYDDFKKSKMTDDELRESEKKQLAERQNQLALKESEYAVRDLFTNADISKQRYEKILSKVVTSDKDKSIEIAQTFIDVLSESTEETKKQTVTDLLNGTPKPTVSTPNGGTVSNLEFYKNRYDEAVKNGDFLAQTQYMRLMQEEQMKLNKPNV
nr:MAG TPA: Major head protein [Caudoviricetes sp.]